MKPIFKKYKIKKNKSSHGDYSLSAIEFKDYLDWDPKRIYYVTGISEKSGVKTGAHCHKVEKELFVMISGSCTAIINYGKGLKKHKMKGPYSVFYVGNYVWHGFENFSKDAVLLALTSTNYNSDRSDYIENYAEFRKIFSKGKM